MLGEKLKWPLLPNKYRFKEVGFTAHKLGSPEVSKKPPKVWYLFSLKLQSLGSKLYSFVCSEFFFFFSACEREIEFSLLKRTVVSVSIIMVVVEC